MAALNLVQEIIVMEILYYISRYTCIVTSTLKYSHCILIHMYSSIKADLIAITFHTQPNMPKDTRYNLQDTLFQTQRTWLKHTKLIYIKTMYNKQCKIHHCLYNSELNTLK